MARNDAGREFREIETSGWTRMNNSARLRRASEFEGRVERADEKRALASFIRQQWWKRYAAADD